MCFGQRQWSIEECIDYAKTNNLEIQQGEIEVQIQEQNLRKARSDRYPTLNGIATNNYNFGQRIDPFTNQFASTRVRSNSFALNTDVDIFRGFQLNNSIKKEKKDYEITVKRLEKSGNDLSLSVAGAYLNILLQKEVIKLMENELDLSKSQLDQTIKLVEAGSIPQGDLLNAQSQVARNEFNLLSAQNELRLLTLNLKLLMRLPADTNLQIQSPNIEVEDVGTELIPPGEIYEQSLEVMPEIAIAELSLESSEKAVDIARGSASPVLRLGASYGTGYSGLRQEVIGTEFAGQVEIGETSTGLPVFADRFNSVSQVVPFSQQLENNLNQTIGLSLTIPLFNNFSSRTNINTAKLNLEQSKLNLELARQEIRNNVERAHADAIAAFSNYQSMEKAVESMVVALDYSAEKYDSGLLNVIEFNQEKNNLLRAKSELIQAKFDYIFKVKILDFYLGKPIRI